MVALPSAGRGRPGQGVGGESWDGPLADTQLGSRPLCLLSSGALGCTHTHTCTHTHVYTKTHVCTTAGSVPAGDSFASQTEQG